MVSIDLSKTCQGVEGFGVMVPAHSAVNSAIYSNAFLSSLIGDLGCSIIRTMFLTQEGAVPDSSLLDIQLKDLRYLLSIRPDLKILASISSPPMIYKDDKGRLRSECREAFGEYLMDMCDIFDSQGCPLYGFGLQNSPQMGTTLGYDRLAGSSAYCKYDTESYYQMYKVLHDLKVRRGCTVRLIAPEDSLFYNQQLDDTLRKITSDPMTSSELSFIGALDYADTTRGALAVQRSTDPNATLVDLYRHSYSEAAITAAKYSRDLWVLETCSEEQLWTTQVDYSQTVTPRDPQYFSRLPVGCIGLALKIMGALVQGNASAYVYWLASTVPDETFEHNIYGNYSEQAMCVSGMPTEKFQVAKHFFKYIKPGMVRVNTTSKDVSSCAFKSASEIVIILINDSDRIIDTDVLLSEAIEVLPYVSYTSVYKDYHRLLPGNVVGGCVSLTLLPSSIVTIVVG